jgi:opacity protein-like surface antigen
MKLQDIKNSKLAVLGGCALLAACATTMRADDITPGFYMSTDGGLNMVTGIRGTASGGSNLRTDAGTRWGLEAGYGFKLADQLTLGVEVESGIIWNSFSSFTSGGSEIELGGNLYQVPVLGNVVLNYHFGRWVPYIGAGGGLDYISGNVWSADNAATGVAAGSDWGPAVQGIAGVKYELTQKMELGLGYKYLAAFSERLGNQFDGGDRLSQVNNHTISLSFTYHF